MDYSLLKIAYMTVVIIYVPIFIDFGKVSQSSREHRSALCGLCVFDRFSVARTHMDVQSMKNTFNLVVFVSYSTKRNGVCC